MTFPVPHRLAVAVLALGLGLLACSSADPDPTKGTTSGAGNEKRDTEIKHEPCDTNASSAAKVDINGDGRADIIHVMSGSREVCRSVDLNLDGAPDAFIYYDERGNERRRESDFDRDGRADEIAIYENGQIKLKLRETNFDNKIDTWDYYDNGRLVRRERDSDGDGIIDQWWQFDPNNPKCATVSSDRNADGKPDPDSVVDLCGESYGAPPKGAPGATPSATPSAAPPVPTGPATTGSPGGGSPGATVAGPAPGGPGGALGVKPPPGASAAPPGPPATKPDPKK